MFPKILLFFMIAFKPPISLAEEFLHTDLYATMKQEIANLVEKCLNVQNVLRCVLSLRDGSASLAHRWRGLQILVYNRTTNFEILIGRQLLCGNVRVEAPKAPVGGHAWYIHVPENFNINLTMTELRTDADAEMYVGAVEVVDYVWQTKKAEQIPANSIVPLVYLITSHIAGIQIGLRGQVTPIRFQFQFQVVPRGLYETYSLPKVYDIEVRDTFLPSAPNNRYQNMAEWLFTIQATAGMVIESRNYIRGSPKQCTYTAYDGPNGKSALLLKEICANSTIKSSSFAIFNRLYLGMQEINHTMFEFRYKAKFLDSTEFDVPVDGVNIHLNYINFTTPKLYKFILNQTKFPGKYINFTLLKTHSERVGRRCQFGGLFIIDGELVHGSKMGPLCGQVLSPVWMGRQPFTTHGSVLIVFVYSFHTETVVMVQMLVSHTDCQTLTNLCSSGRPQNEIMVYDAGIVVEILTSLTKNSVTTHHVAGRLHGKQDTCVRLQFYPAEGKSQWSETVCIFDIAAIDSIITAYSRSSISEKRCQFEQNYLQDLISTHGIHELSGVHVTAKHKSYYRSSLALQYRCIHFGFHASLRINFVPVPSKLYCEHKKIQAAQSTMYSQYIQISGRCVFASFPFIKYKETKSFQLMIFPQHIFAEMSFHVSENCGDDSALSGYWHIEVCMTYQGSSNHPNGITNYLYCYQQKLREGQRLTWFLMTGHVTMKVTPIQLKLPTCLLNARFMDQGRDKEAPPYDVHTADNGTGYPCPDNWLNLHHGRCYQVLPRGTLSWDAAQEVCHKEGGHLISFNSHEEWMDVLYDTANTFLYQSGGTTSYNRWEELTFSSAAHRPPLIMIGLRRNVSKLVHMSIA